MIAEQWKILGDKTAQLQLREKWIIFAGLLFLLGWLGTDLLLLPLWDEIDIRQQQIERKNAQVEIAQQQIDEYREKLKKDPNVMVRQSIKTLENSISTLDKDLDTLTADFISPSKMREVLLQLLNSESRVKVTKFNALAAVAMDIPEIPEEIDIVLYQHGLKLSLSGSYFDLQRYLKQIESLPWRFYWKQFSYRVEQYPKSTLEIEIITISNNERFIAI